MKRQDGFTLMEMLVAMTLLSLLLMALFGGLRFVRDGESRADAVIDESETMDVVRYLLTRQLANEFPAATEGVPPRLLFTARADRLAFPILRPPGLGPSGMILAVFDIVGDNGRRQLIYREYPFKPGGQVQVADQPTRSTVLAAGSAQMRFLYGDRSGDWQDSWAAGQRAPRLVGLSNPPWPLLVAAPQAELAP
jgi:general secretion pathway protein J